MTSGVLIVGYFCAVLRLEITQGIALRQEPKSPLDGIALPGASDSYIREPQCHGAGWTLLDRQPRSRAPT